MYTICNCRERRTSLWRTYELHLHILLRLKRVCILRIMGVTAHRCTYLRYADKASSVKIVCRKCAAGMIESRSVSYSSPVNLSEVRSPTVVDIKSVLNGSVSDIRGD
jgi:hypothetical protein